MSGGVSQVHKHASKINNRRRPPKNITDNFRFVLSKQQKRLIVY